MAISWIQQLARNLTDSVDGVLRGKRYLIHDRDPLFTESFRAVLRAAGVSVRPNLGEMPLRA